MTDKPSYQYQCGCADPVSAPFPGGARDIDQRRGEVRLDPLDEIVLQRAVLSWGLALAELLKSRST